MCRICLESIESQLSVIEKILAHPLGFTRRPITLRNHIPKNYVFSWRSAYAPYATCMATPLSGSWSLQVSRCKLLCVFSNDRLFWNLTKFQTLFWNFAKCRRIFKLSPWYPEVDNSSCLKRVATVPCHIFGTHFNQSGQSKMAFLHHCVLLKEMLKTVI